jgi:hypothetical protein
VGKRFIERIDEAVQNLGVLITAVVTRARYSERRQIKEGATKLP